MHSAPELFVPVQHSESLVMYRVSKADVWSVGAVLLAALNKEPNSKRTRKTTQAIATPPYIRQDNSPTSVLIQWLLEPDYFLRPTSKQAMLLCGALIFLSPQCTSMLCSPEIRDLLINLQQSAVTSLLTSDIPSKQAIAAFMTNKTRIRMVMKNLNEFISTRKREDTPPAPAQLMCLLMFSTAALSDVEFFQRTMLEFCITKDLMYNKRSLATLASDL
ncbi:hypothetical protein Pelo_9876 [Pelomyxa schiedti]|nr:hypothetical protein Pelo_9876 [Pelomyxa schiedti]